jgi:mannose PTS system EIID component
MAAPPPTGAPLPSGMRPGPLPVGTRASMLLRCLAIQGAWNYEILNGNGIGFCVEPALRHLPGGVDGDAYRAALARQCAYFNAHPYLASLAVGALARAELDQTPPDKLVRFRTALCGPLGSLGDRLVWAAWLPACSLVALLLFGLGAGPALVALGFLGLYNAGHLALRAWGLGAGWLHGLRLASALGANWLQRGPQYIARGGRARGGSGAAVRSASRDRWRRLARARVTRGHGLHAGAWCSARASAREGGRVATALRVSTVLH